MNQHLNWSSVKHIQEFINHFFNEMLSQIQDGIWVKWNHLVLEPSFWGKISISKSWTILSFPIRFCDIKLFQVSNQSLVEQKSCRTLSTIWSVKKGFRGERREEHPFVSAKLTPMEREEEEENNTLDFLSSIYFYIFCSC